MLEHREIFKHSETFSQTVIQRLRTENLKRESYICGSVLRLEALPMSDVDLIYFGDKQEVGNIKYDDIDRVDNLVIDNYVANRLLDSMSPESGFLDSRSILGKKDHKYYKKFNKPQYLINRFIWSYNFRFLNERSDNITGFNLKYSVGAYRDILLINWFARFLDDKVDRKKPEILQSIEKIKKAIKYNYDDLIESIAVIMIVKSRILYTHRRTSSRGRTQLNEETLQETFEKDALFSKFFNHDKDLFFNKYLESKNIIKEFLQTIYEHVIKKYNNLIFDHVQFAIDILSNKANIDFSAIFNQDKFNSFPVYAAMILKNKIDPGLLFKIAKKITNDPGHFYTNRLIAKSSIANKQTLKYVLQNSKFAIDDWTNERYKNVIAEKLNKKDLVILSLAFNYHDSNVALSVGKNILASLEIERLFRSKKINASLTHMEIAAKYLLESYQLNIEDVDFLVVNALNNPFDDKKLEEDVREIEVSFLGKKTKTFVVRHHLAHAGYFYLSRFNKALIVSCDGGGDLGERLVYFIGDDLKISRIDFNIKNHISTKPYGQFSTFLYGDSFSEGKLMGLSGFCKKVEKKLLQKVSGIFPLLKDADFVAGQKILIDNFPMYKGLARDNPRRCSRLALCVQKEFVRQRLSNLKEILSAHNEECMKKLVLVGGSALNLECNSEIYNFFKREIFIPPCCDDTGIAVGQCAVIIARELKTRPRFSMPFLNPNEDINSFNLTRKRLESYKKSIEVENLPKKIAQRLLNGEICIRHAGRSEVGPRALGHRSFLMSPIHIKNRNIINEIKKREWYRPVAPIMLEQDLKKYFYGGPKKSPFMLFSYKANPNIERLAPAIIHFDGTSRVQTINKKTDPVLYNILIEFRRKTGIGILINTSLNLKNQPLSHFLHDTLEIMRKIHYKSFLCLK